MKYLIPIVLLLALCGCERPPPESQDSAEGVVPAESLATEQVAFGKTPNYLNKPLTGKIGQRGLYRLVRSGGVINDPKTGTGKAVSKPVVQLVRSTERIPLMKGAQMYLKYRIWPLPDLPAYVDLRRVLKHPEMTLPDGSVSTGSDYMIKGKVSVNQVIAYTGYGLDEDYELVEGDWVFEIWYQDTKIIEQKFTTYRPYKEEIAALEPLLALGNKVLTQVESPGKPGSGPSWPRMVVGKEEIDANPGLSDLKRSLDDPLNQP